MITRFNAPNNCYCFEVTFQPIGDQYLCELSIEKCAETAQEARELVWDYLEDMYGMNITVLNDTLRVKRNNIWQIPRKIK